MGLGEKAPVHPTGVSVMLGGAGSLLASAVTYIRRQGGRLTVRVWNDCPRVEVITLSLMELVYEELNGSLKARSCHTHSQGDLVTQKCRKRIYNLKVCR